MEYVKRNLEDVIWWLLAPIATIAFGFKFYEFGVTVLGGYMIVYLVIFFRRKDKFASFFYFLSLMFMNVVGFGLIYSNLGLNAPDLNHNFQIGDFMYFSVVTWTTLGYGDFTPNADSRMYAAIEAVYGYFYSGILVTKLFYWLSESNGTREGS
jgi:hypothetical protein